MDATKQGIQCRWAGCPVEFENETEWIKHVAIHVFTLKPGERTPWLGPPELDPDIQHVSAVEGNLSDGEENDGDDDDDRAFSQINALSSPASTPPQIGLPESPDLAEKINGPESASAIAIQPLRLLTSDALERSSSNRTSASAEDVEADLIPTSPTASISASQDTNSNSSQEPSEPLHSSHPPFTSTQSHPSSANVNMFRHGVFHMSSRSGPRMSTSLSRGPQNGSQSLLRSPDSSQTGGNGTSWLNTQAFRLPDTQDSYDSD